MCNPREHRLYRFVHIDRRYIDCRVGFDKDTEQFIGKSLAYFIDTFKIKYDILEAFKTEIHAFGLRAGYECFAFVQGQPDWYYCL